SASPLSLEVASRCWRKGSATTFFLASFRTFALLDPKTAVFEALT
uniref:Uncharacterized protein n=1 Tax=Anopheles dirus TaxID=7168 RepID=A0A182NWX2_9DIPT